MWDLLLLSAIAFLIGIVAAMLGIGGVFMVPTLLLTWYDLDPAVASGTSLAAIIFTSLFSTSGIESRGG